MDAWRVLPVFNRNVHIYHYPVIKINYALQWLISLPPSTTTLNY